MRIRVRRGSVSLETVMIVPVAVTLILIGRYVLEAGLTRQELAVYTRTATATAAAYRDRTPLSCDADRAPFTGTSDVTRTAQVACSTPDGERGLKREKKFFDALRSGAKAWPRILRDVSKASTRDMRGDGNGSMTFVRPDFLKRQGSISPTTAYQIPQDALWSAVDRPWTAAHDKVIWQELGSRTQRLVPNLFPARNK